MDAEGAVTQITRVEETPADPRWSPDGKVIAFAMLAPDSSVWKISLPQPPQGAKWTPAPRVVDDLHYRQDRVGLDRKSTRLNSSHGYISYAVFCLKKKKTHAYTGSDSWEN